MRIQSQPPTPPATPQKPPAPPSTPPAADDQFTPGSPQQPQPPQPPKYKSWEPLASGATAAALIGIPSALGALENQLFGATAASAITAIATPAVFGIGAATWAYRSSKEEFNSHPVLVGITTLGCGLIAAGVAPIAKMPGALWGWQGAAIATAVTGVGVGIAAAIGMHKANQQQQ